MLRLIEDAVRSVLRCKKFARRWRRPAPGIVIEVSRVARSFVVNDVVGYANERANRQLRRYSAPSPLPAGVVRGSEWLAAPSATFLAWSL